ncbi:unnamed protein product [Closterium sp. NIES-64]|nr:unnamed protein product [Closterium sp. NIES-64]
MKQNIDIFALDFDAILSTMYVMSISGEGAQYLSVPPDPGIRPGEATALGARVSATPGAGEAATLGAGASASPVTDSTEALHTFTLDSGASRCFFHDRTTLEQLARPVAVSLADPSGGPVLATFSTVLPCLAGRQRAAPHSSSFPPTTAPLQTLHMDVWGPARVRGQGQERYFLIVVDDYSRYTTVFPLHTKGEVPDVLIPWIRPSRLQLSERFHSDFPVLRLHSDRGGEFSSDLLAAYCAEHGIRQSFTLPASPQQNGVNERRIGLVMEVARTSLIHAVAPRFLWPFAVRYAAHQLNLWPRVSLPETSPTLHWMGEVGDASRFRDVTFDESVPFYRLFPYRTAPLPPQPLFLAPGAAAVDPLPPQGAAPSGVSQVDPVEPVEVAVDSRPARGAEPERAEPGVAETGGAESEGTDPGGTEPGGVEPGSAEPASAESGGAERGSATPGGALSSQQLRECLRSGAPSVADSATGAADPDVGAATGAADSDVGAAAGTVDPGVGAPAGAADPDVGAAAGAADPDFGAAAGAVDLGVGAAAGAANPDVGVAAGNADAGVGAAAGAAEPGVGAAAGATDPGVGAATSAADPGVGGAGGAAGAVGGSGAVSAAAGGTSRPRPYFVPLLQQSSLPALADPFSDSLRAVSPTVTRLLATGVTDTSFESAAASALVAELVDFGARCRLDYAASLVAESESVCPPSVGGECALSTDVLQDRHEDLECLAAAAPHLVSMLVAPEGDPDAPDIPTPRSYADAIEGPYSSQWQSAMDTEMASWKSTGTYVDKGSLHEEIWLRRPPGFTGSFPPGTQWSLRRPVYGLRQAPRDWHDTLRTTLAAVGFSPSTADPSLFLCTDTSLPPFYILVYVDDLVFATADTESLTHVKSELQKRHTCTDLGELRSYLGL